MTNRRSFNAWAEDPKEEQTTGAILQGPTGKQGTKGRQSLSGEKMGDLLLVSLRGVHSKWGRFCTFSSGLPVNQWYEFGRGQVWPSVLLVTSPAHPHAQDHQILTSVQAGSERTGRQGGGI